MGGYESDGGGTPSVLDRFQWWLTCAFEALCGNVWALVERWKQRLIG